ncbi:acyl-CoA thioesterase [Actinomadura alba]|uniref:Thioesterase family protein n=1 Tax=Actinomadura alba TaxID=406431 RepID=A0ABR7M261_9ACTN|nr:acyl-CoA thioesterase domain-containing protein [Actinomadura alba]MBC6471105.1 thioesterase family protein [Actinomadura alba]
MTDASSFQKALELEQLDSDLFEALFPGVGRGRTFGGQVAAQSLRAAGLTVGRSRNVHSLHSYFIRPGRPEEPLRFEVARTRDGRTFSTRSVTAVQEGKPIFEMIASFHDPEPGEDWQAVAPLSVPPPEDLRPVRLSRLFGDGQAFEIRPVVTPDPEGFPISHPFWVRVPVPVDIEPDLHACLLTYLSDIAVVRAARSPESDVSYGLRVSLDHSIWFHRQARVDQWLLYTMSPVAHIGVRGLAQGSMRDVEGTLVASVAQEVLLRR